ncbi:MAG: AMP-binding protein [Candidatus Rokubacteria bacterium]|nr:AMP-binding protein [Candidatus Rokubacteria bacterium]
MIARYTEAGFWGSRIWTDYLDETAERAPDRPALIDASGSLTYAELRRAVDGLALHLLDLGATKGDRFGIQLPNWREFVATRFALAKIGAVAVPMPADWRRKEVEYVLGATAAMGFVAPAQYRGRDYVEEYAPMRQALPGLRTVMAARPTAGVPDGWRALPPLGGLTVDPRAAERLRAARPGPNDVDLIVTTSGSTAAPKLVVRTPNCFLTTTKQFVGSRGFLTGTDVVAGLAPIARGVGYWIGVAAPILAGCTMALLEHFTPEGALRWLADTRATAAIAVPTQIVKMLQVPDVERYDLRAFRLFVNGGAAIPPSAAEEVERRMGCVTMSAYGAVEGGIPTCTSMDDPPDKRYRTVGRLMPGMEMRIVDDAGHAQPVGTPGELVYRGPNLSVGFWANPDAYRQLFDGDGWFRSGDLGVIDAAGYLTIVGRKKEIVIRGGINISPTEVEGLLQDHPGVRQMAIVKMPDRVLGERCCAYVVPAPGATVTVESLAEFLAARDVAKYKFPERVELLDDLPTTGEGGKVLRRALEDDIRTKLEREGKV